MLYIVLFLKLSLQQVQGRIMKLNLMSDPMSMESIFNRIVAMLIVGLMAGAERGFFRFELCNQQLHPRAHIGCSGPNFIRPYTSLCPICSANFTRSLDYMQC
ncbi:hypothetical protein AB3S75_009137 [Citrus x aurantiifolia]